MKININIKSINNVFCLICFILIILFNIKFVNINTNGGTNIYSFILNPIEIDKGVYIFSAIIERKKIRLIVFNNFNNRTLSNNNFVLKIEKKYLSNIKIIRYIGVHEKYYNILLDKPKIVISNNLLISKKKIYLFNNYKYKLKYNLLFCLTTLFSYNNSNRFIEFVEYYRNFGVDKFIVYNTNCSDNIIKIFKYYTKIGLMDILYDNFTHNLYEIKRFHVWKQNDCFHRYKYYAKRIIFHDHDEIIYSPVYNNSINLFAKINNNASIFHFYPKLTITNGKGFFNKGFYSICPNDPWKFVINKNNCVLQVVVHDIILKSNNKCFKEIISMEDAYILHARNTPSKKYHKLCKNWTYESNFNKRKALLNYQTKLIYSLIYNK